MVRITAQWILPMCQIIIIFCIFHSCQCLFSDVDCNYARKKIIDLIDPVQMEFQSLRKFRSNDQMSSNYHNLSLHLSHPISCHSATHNWLIFVIFSCEKENIQNSNTIKQKKTKCEKLQKLLSRIFTEYSLLFLSRTVCLNALYPFDVILEREGERRKKRLWWHFCCKQLRHICTIIATDISVSPFFSITIKKEMKQKMIFISR